MAFTTGNIGKEVLQKALESVEKHQKRLSEIKRPKQSSISEIGFGDGRRFSAIMGQEFSDDVPTLTFNIQINELFKCTCHLCQDKMRMKFKSVPTSPLNKPKSRAALLSERHEKSFSYLLKILLPNFGNAPKGLKFLIADTLVFSFGDPRFLVYNSRDKYIRFIKQKEKLSFPDMKKFFQTRKKRKELDGVNFFNENEWTVRKKIDEALKKTDTPRIIETSSYALQERPSLTKKEKRVLTSTAHQDIVLCKYADESVQVLSELDFSYLMMKRKVEALWAQLDYIQTYIKLKKEHPYYIKIDFDFERDHKKELYEKARDYIYYLTQEREPELEGYDYATEEDYFEEGLKQKDIYEYCQYLNFKLICYLDAYCAARVKSMMSEYAWEESNLVYLINANKIQFFSAKEMEDYTLKEIFIVNDEEREKVLEKLNNAPKSKSAYQGKVEMLKAFRQYYGEVKKHMGLNPDFDHIALENPQSNEAFKQLNPETSFTLYDVMTDPKEFEKFKAWLHNRAQKVGPQSGFFQSALHSTVRSSNFGLSPTAKFTKPAPPSTSIKSPIQSPRSNDSKKIFMKKLKILDICGNGAAKKKFIDSTPIVYKTGLYSSRKYSMHNSTAAYTEQNKVLLTQMTSNADIKSPKSPKFKLSTHRSISQEEPDQSMINRAKSLTSMIYVKPGYS